MRLSFIPLYRVVVKSAVEGAEEITAGQRGGASKTPNALFVTCLPYPGPAWQRKWGIGPI